MTNYKVKEALCSGLLQLTFKQWLRTSLQSNLVTYTLRQIKVAWLLEQPSSSLCIWFAIRISIPHRTLYIHPKKECYCIAPTCFLGKQRLYFTHLARCSNVCSKLCAVFVQTCKMAVFQSIWSSIKLMTGKHVYKYSSKFKRSIS